MKTKIPYIFIAISFLFNLCGCQNTQNQDQPAAEIGPSIITPENIDQLEYIERWGRGGINLAVLSDNPPMKRVTLREHDEIADIVGENNTALCC